MIYSGDEDEDIPIDGHDHYLPPRDEPCTRGDLLILAWQAEKNINTSANTVETVKPPPAVSAPSPAYTVYTDTISEFGETSSYKYKIPKGTLPPPKYRR